jgi:hypothetical protein
VAVQDHPYVGADVNCPACREPNAAAAKCCKNCGSPLDGSKAVGMRADQVHAVGGFAGDSAQAARAEFYGGPKPGAAAAPPPEPKKSRVGWIAGIGCLGVVVVAVVALLFCGLWKREAALEVTGQSWERSIQIERYGQVRATDWCSEMPAGAHEISREKQQKSTQKVPDGEDCKMRKKDRGDGTFKEVKECTPKYKDAPVLADKCTYDATKWTATRKETARGASASEPRTWPPITLMRIGTCEGCERAGARTEVYKVTLREPKSGESYDCELPETKWTTFTKGSKWKGQVGKLTTSLDCGSLSPAK